MGPKWVRLQAQLDAMFTPLTEAAMAFAAPSAGERAVDIGCGCGGTVLELAARVGPGGSVLGVDVSEPMLDVARRRAAALGQVRLELADASTHAFAPEADLLFSRFGVMFFDDPPAAFANLRRALRPGGRLALAVWRPLTENPWMLVPLQAVLPLLPPQPPADPEAPGPFALADSDRLRRILAAAGFSAIELTPHDTVLRVPGDVAEAAGFIIQMGPASRALAEADEATMAAAQAAIREALVAHRDGDGVALTGAIWLVGARF
jgi:SAM-dependent methyltransferase